MNIIDDVPNTKTKRVYKFTLDNDSKIESSIFNNSFLSAAFFLTNSVFFYS